MMKEYFDRILVHLNQTQDSELTEFFLYDFSLEELNILSIKFEEFMNVEDIDNCFSTEEQEILAEILNTIYIIDNPLYYEKEEQDESYLEHSIYKLLTTISTCKLAKMKKIKFDNTHLHPSEWLIKIM